MRSWSRHEAAWLRDYLVAGVEDPRINLQSVRTRHFVAHALYGDRFRDLMREEIRFAAVMNWLLALANEISDAEESGVVLDALRRGSDNAEGRAIPRFVNQTFRDLTSRAGDLDYVTRLLTGLAPQPSGKFRDHDSLNTFRDLWHTVTEIDPGVRPKVYEAACGSANDYRFLHAYGLARWLDYCGGDLCPQNIENARRMFPGISFEEHNVFSLPAPDRAYDLCFFHDLLEHLSPAGMQTAIAELCRVCRRDICGGFFNMDEMPAHLIEPVEDYHWNRLSLDQTLAEFERHGFIATTVAHIGSWLRREIGCEQTHNPFAYSIEFMRRSKG